MAYVPGYAADIFVSYSHSNDRDGWVTELKSKLASGLADLSEDVDVWFDAERLQTGDRFKQEIQDKLSDTRILIAVLSPAYLKSHFFWEPTAARQQVAAVSARFSSRRWAEVLSIEVKAPSTLNNHWVHRQNGQMKVDQS